MEQALTQRLVGAAVIIAVGVIVIPVLLDSAGERQLRKMPDSPSPTFESSPGMVAEEKIMHPANENRGHIVLTLPDAESDSAVVKEEKAKSGTALTNNDHPPAQKNSKPEKPEPAKAIPDTPKPVATQAVKEPPRKPAVKAPTAAKPTPPVTEKSSTSSPLNSTWVVQVGSFTDAKKAFQFRDRLRKKKYKAFVEKISGRSGQSLYRVRLGPLPSRDMANVLSGQLKQQGIKGFVTRHP